MIPSALISFREDISHVELPAELNDPFAYQPHQLCKIAARQLQDYLYSQADFDHNFGLGMANENISLKPIGKMFGVLVVQFQSQVYFLAAFSGKLSGSNTHPYFVPPVYDSLAEGTFLTPGMLQLKAINEELKELQHIGCKAIHHIRLLKEKRKAHSQQLQKKLFKSYQFLNSQGDKRSPIDIFEQPPAGAGECAAPKLLQYAFQYNLKPITMAEFWYGAPPSSSQNSREHLSYYPACDDKCRGVLGWMLG